VPGGGASDEGYGAGGPPVRLEDLRRRDTLREYVPCAGELYEKSATAATPGCAAAKARTSRFAPRALTSADGDEFVCGGRVGRRDAPTPGETFGRNEELRTERHVLRRERECSLPREGSTIRCASAGGKTCRETREATTRGEPARDFALRSGDETVAQWTGRRSATRCRAFPLTKQPGSFLTGG